MEEVLAWVNILPNGFQEIQLVNSALCYARRGWPVVPLHTIIGGRCSCEKPDCDTSSGKHPLTRNGLKDATCDEAIINDWWRKEPMANIGIAAGPESGFFMVGPDGQAGIDALSAMEARHGPLSRTPQVRSGGGGRHYYFAWPADGSIKNAANHDGLPIDVRGEGGLVVAPPSLHLSGNRYEWEVPPEEIELAVAPAWLLEWLRSGKGMAKTRKGRDKPTNQTSPPPRAANDSFNSFVRKEPPANGKVVFTVQPHPSQDVQARAIAYLAICPPAISGQGGHTQTFEAARAVVYGFNMGPDIGYEVLNAHYNPRCQPPWSERELRHKCEEADRQPYGKPRGYLLNEAPPSLGISSFVRGPAPPEEEIETLPMPPPPPWPTLAPEALYGLPGEVVRIIAPETESDPVAILGQMLVMFGNAVGRGPRFEVEGDAHHANLFLCLVGESSRARKGTSRGRVMQLMEYADATWCRDCVTSGLSSGEGMIWAVRDPIEKKEPIKAKGRVVGYQTVVADEGVLEKRLVFAESEFAQVLRVMQREGNSLSPVIRQSWDTGTLRTTTKNSPARATGAHISIVGHVTKPELAKYLRDTEVFNGFANRFCWLCVRRSKLLPDGGRALDLSPLGVKLNHALAVARNVGPMSRDGRAVRLWREVYPRLTAERSGLAGTVTGRAEAQVLRLSMVYALLDAAPLVIAEEHLRAALAVWDYAEESARLIFGAVEEDPLVGMVLAKLRESPHGLTRTELSNAFSRNIESSMLLAALANLRDRGEAHAEKERAGKPGAPAERWKAGRKDHPTAPAAPCPGAGERTNESITGGSACGKDVRVNSFVRSPSLGESRGSDGGVNSFVRPADTEPSTDGEEVVTI